MKEPPEYLDDTAKEAIHAAKNAAQAVEIARQTQLEATAQSAADKVADKIVDEDRIAEIVKTQILNVLTMGSEKDRAIVLARVPYICASIESIDMKLDVLKNYPIVEMIVFGFVGLILVSVVGALLTLVVLHS